jgi:hypothetical protein
MGFAYDAVGASATNGASIAAGIRTAGASCDATKAFGDATGHTSNIVVASDALRAPKAALGDVTGIIARDASSIRPIGTIGGCLRLWADQILTGRLCRRHDGAQKNGGGDQDEEQDGGFPGHDRHQRTCVELYVCGVPQES